MHQGETTRRTVQLQPLLPATLLLLALATAAPAAVYVVPDDPGCETLTGCIAQASYYSGDTIRVRPGVYAEAVDFLGKTLTLVSEEGPEYTVIEGAVGAESGVSFFNGEGRGAVLRGFTVTRGIGCIDSSPSILENVLTGEGVSGAGVFVMGRAAPLIESNRFEALNAETGICSLEGALPTIANNSFREVGGGAPGWSVHVIHVDTPAGPGMLRITGNQISQCRAAGPLAGIVVEGYYWPWIGITPPGVLVQGNRISGCGSLGTDSRPAYTVGIYVMGLEDVVVSENRVVANDAHAPSGGSAELVGIDLAVSGEARVENNLVAANAASSDVMGTSTGIRVYSQLSARLANNTVSDNHGTDPRESGESAGVEVGGMSETLDVRNNIVTNNAPPAGLAGGASRGLVLDPPAGLLADWNDVTGHDADYDGLEPGPHDLSVDPLFVDPDSGDYHLRPGSPCVDRGTDAGVLEDLDGDPRPIGLGFDMGADEAADPCPGAPGDVNHDGAVDVADGLLAFRFALGIQTPGACEFRRADVVVDGRVTTSDAACIYRFAHGLPGCLD